MASASPGAPTVSVDAELKRRALRKVVRRLIPFMGLPYFINDLDRTNIGFATFTMSKDLALTETMFALASGIFFLSYLVLEVPSNLAEVPVVTAVLRVPPTARILPRSGARGGSRRRMGGPGRALPGSQRS